MTLFELVAGCWAIEPDKLREIQAIYATHLRGEKIDISSVEARLGRPLVQEDQEYVLRDGGIAVLSMSGILAPKANMFMRVSGGMSTQIATKQLESAAVDGRVRAIVVAMDTPGGSVLGVPEFAAAIAELANVKPIVFHSDGQLASAGYWSASAANAIFISGPVVQVGSIGVVVSRNYNPNSSTQEEHITAGKYKRLVKANEPLSADSRAIVQADVDYVYSLFVDDVAKYRGTTSEAVLEHMADGRVFRGQQAIDAGLVDGVSTLDALVEQMAAEPGKFATRRRARIAASKPKGTPKSDGAGAAHEDDLSAINQGNPPMDKAEVTRESLQKDHAPLYATLQKEFTEAGAKQECERQKAVRATVVPGHEALVETLANDGHTTAAEAALAVNAAVRAAHSAAATAHANDAPSAAPGAAAPADKPTDKAAQLAAAQAHMKAKGSTDLVAALKELGFAQ
ncbi:MAG: S49 family peptidase [Comamonadaceae bacterium]|nr:MAG: S49 family peptidase [Comamonadaceae bacterium]